MSYSEYPIFEAEIARTRKYLYLSIYIYIYIFNIYIYIYIVFYCIIIWFIWLLLYYIVYIYIICIYVYCIIYILYIVENAYIVVTHNRNKVPAHNYLFKVFRFLNSFITEQGLLKETLVCMMWWGSTSLLK